MKAAFLTLSMIALASTAAAEPPRHLQGWFADARQEIQQAAGREAPGSGTVAVQFTVGSDQLRGARVVQSSGSAAVDAAVLKAASRVRPPRPPVELLGNDVTVRVTLGHPTVLTAGTPSTAR